MTAITKSIEITEERRSRLDLDLPEGLPTGKAELRLTINPVQTAPETSTRKPFEGLFGALKNSGVYDGNGVGLQRQWRDDWSE